MDSSQYGSAALDVGHLARGEDEVEPDRVAAELRGRDAAVTASENRTADCGDGGTIA